MWSWTNKSDFKTFYRVNEANQLFHSCALDNAYRAPQAMFCVSKTVSIGCLKLTAKFHVLKHAK